MAEHTKTPWAWTIHDSSAASIEGPKDMLDHVLTVSPCKHCRGEDWQWGSCTNPTKADADFIITAVNNYQPMQDVLVDIWFHLSATTDPTLRKIADSARSLIPTPVGGPAK